ncbi:MAG: hypothetical protein VB071_02695 [Lawsonibacter sp.]|nr:hypothetical protein [Lawsonibacter sp.]
MAIDQGGSMATSNRATTHDNPCYKKYGVVHDPVANMPGAVPKVSIFVLARAALPFHVKLAGKGVEQALREDAAWLAWLNTTRASSRLPGCAPSTAGSRGVFTACFSDKSLV